MAEYVRLFDVTERTALRRHKTGRTCHKCKGPLKDSIIHFGEKSPPHSPYNWRQAAKCADDADLIVCLGTSLKVSVQTTLTVTLLSGHHKVHLSVFARVRCGL